MPISQALTQKNKKCENMNRYLSFFLIFAIAFVLLPYIATVETRRETSPAFAQITDGTENGSEVLSAVGKDDEIICRLCTLSDYIKSDESIKAAAVALRTKALYDKNNRLSAEDNGFYGSPSRQSQTASGSTEKTRWRRSKRSWKRATDLSSHITARRSTRRCT